MIENWKEMKTAVDNLRSAYEIYHTYFDENLPSDHAQVVHTDIIPKNFTDWICDINEIIEDWDQILDEEMEKKHQGEITVLAHIISFRWSGEQKITSEMQEALTELAENRAKECIIEGYVSGELIYDNDNLFYRGWWEIKK